MIGRAGDPLVMLVPYRPQVKERQGGQWRGRVQVGEDFDDLPADLASAFRGEQP